MRFLADESIEAAIETRLRAEGHDVVSVSEEKPGAEDARVLSWATREGRILLTNDKDFADLAYLQRRASAGIVLVRLGRFHSTVKSRRVAEVVRQQGRSLQNAMTVVEAHAIRRRPLPSGSR